jgi:hypothetical protein
MFEFDSAHVTYPRARQHAVILFGAALSYFSMMLLYACWKQLYLAASARSLHGPPGRAARGPGLVFATEKTGRAGPLA